MNVRPETIKPLDEIIEENSLTLALAMISWICHQSTGNKSKNRQVGLHQTKSFGAAKQTVNKGKRQPKVW